MTWFETLGKSLEVQAFLYRCARCHTVYASLHLGHTEWEAPADSCKACGFDGENDAGD